MTDRPAPPTSAPPGGQLTPAASSPVGDHRGNGAVPSSSRCAAEPAVHTTLPSVSNPRQGAPRLGNHEDRGGREAAGAHPAESCQSGARRRGIIDGKVIQYHPGGDLTHRGRARRLKAAKVLNHFPGLSRCSVARRTRSMKPTLVGSFQHLFDRVRATRHRLLPAEVQAGTAGVQVSRRRSLPGATDVMVDGARRGGARNATSRAEHCVGVGEPCRFCLVSFTVSTLSPTPFRRYKKALDFGRACWSHGRRGRCRTARSAAMKTRQL